MRFAWPHLLWLLAVPAGLLVWELVRRRGAGRTEHPKILRAEAGMSSVSLSDRPGAGLRYSRRRFLLCAGLALAVVALARPQWGRLDEPVFDQSRDIVIALDLSRSMLTPDVRPTRLERAKLLIQSLLDRLHGERVGLIVFSGTAFLQSPVSSDYEILREFLPSLSPDYMPEGGTNYSQLIDTADDAFAGDSAADRYLIILSDGEATDDEWRGRIPELTRRGIKVIGLGVGTAAGGMIPDGAGAFMKDENGAVVLSRLENSTLKDLAAATKGVYRDASEWVDLAKVLDSTVAQGRKGRFVERNSVRYAERYQWALAQALACLLASFLLEVPVRPKAREIRLAAPVPAAPARAAAALAALLVLLLPGRAFADGPPPDGAAALSKVVSRLASQDSRSAVDWAEMGSETVSWGQHAKSGGQPVPERPVRDALRAVDEGERQDAKAADWPRLRRELNELLKKPDEKKQNQKDQQDQKKNQDKQNQDKKNEDKSQQQNRQQQGGKDRQDKDQDQQNQPQRQDGQQRSQQRENEGGSPRRQDPGQSAFGDMGHPSPTPQPRRDPGAMQKVGGARKEDTNDPARADPELAVPLEKLEQLKSQDSPAQLFEMMRKREATPVPTGKGKDW